MLEQVLGAQANTGLTGTTDHLDRDDRVAAEFEEVVVQAHLRQLQHVLPDRRELLLQHALRRLIGLLRLAGVGGRQCVAVELAVGGQRQLRQQHQVRRDHVLRQVVLEGGTHAVTPVRLLFGAAIEHCRIGRHQVRHQLLAAETRLRQHRGLAHGVLLQQLRLDFTQLDTKAPDLHLMVDAPDVLDDPVSAITRQVTGTVQTPTVSGKRIGDEAQAGQVGTVQVTPRQTGAPHIQLTDAAFADRVQVAVEQVPGQVRDRLANRAADLALQVGHGQRSVGHVHRGFGNAVHVDQLRGRIAKAFEPAAQALDLQRFAAKHHVAQRQLAGAVPGRTGHLHQLLEGRWCLVQHADALAAQQGMEIFRRATDLVRHHHQLAAVQQRTKDFPDREVERVGVEQAPDVLRAEAEPGVGGCEQAHHVVVGEQGALGLAGGAGGVDHIRQVVRTHRHLRVGVAVALKPVIVLIEDQAAHVVRYRQAPQHMALAQHQADTAVLDHVGQAFLGVGRVQRHIGPAGLEDGQQAHQHFQAALNRQPHAYIRPYPAVDQRVGQYVGTAVELAVAQGLVEIAHGDRIGITQGLRFDQPVQARLAREIRHRRVPLQQGGRPFDVIVQRQLADALPAIGNHRVQQVQPMPGKPRHGRGVEQVGGVGQFGPEVVGGFEGVQGQVELSRVRGPTQWLDLDVRQPRRTTGFARLALVVVQHLEQRAVTEAALRLQGIDQLLERQVLMGLGAEHAVLDLLQQAAKGLLAVDVGLEHLGVDEEADQAFGFHPAAIGHRHADADLRLAAVAMQQGLERGQQQRKQGDLLALRRLLEAGDQCRAQGDVLTGPAIALLGRARTVGRQFQQWLLAPQLCRPVGQLALALPGLHPLPLPHRVVGVLHRQRRQLRRLPLTVGGIQGDQFVDHDAHRPAVGDDVVQGNDQRMVIGRQAQQLDPQQRALLQIEQVQGLLRHQRLQAVVIQIALDLLHGKVQRSLGLDHLLGLWLIADKTGTQGFVAVDQRVETALQRRQVQLTAQAQGGRHVVGGAGGCQLPEEPLTFLGVGQRQRLLTGQHGNRRRATALFDTQRGDKVLQRAVLEQGAQRHLDIQHLAHPRHHLGHQQRVTTEFEEVIRKPHLLEFQHRLPDLRHPVLGGGPRRDVARLRLAGIGLGQGLAVDLAIGGQR
ncbi:hypothetical protein D3C84_285230 [compost metagenome]